MSDKIFKLRQQLVDKKQAIADLDAAGLPDGDVMALWQAHVDRAIADYSKVVGNLASTTLVARQEQDIDFAGATGLVFGHADKFLTGVVFRHLEKAITDDLKAEIARIKGEYPPGVSDQKRAADRKRLGRELLALERAEEAEIEAELLRGNQIERRADADPRAVLGIPDDALAAAGLL